MNLVQMLEQYRDMKAELQPAIDALKSLEKEIKSHVVETGEVAKGNGVSVALRNGYVRTSWDSKALAGYAAANPEIMQFCKESQVSPSAVIKIG